VSHLERIVEVYNDRLDRWETEALQDLVGSVLYQATFEVLFQHAGQTRLDTVQLGWFRVRLPNTTQPLWILVADDQTLNRQLVLITNIPLEGVRVVQQCITTGAYGHALNMAIASTRNKGWMWKICASIRWNGCAVCLLSFYCLPRCFL